ncbi:MFS transporter [Spirosoma fluviale]|uniref:Dolichyl-phosphate-mannose-protein mannosyltransferase n=1 Tax=Spirosoma fluviale TaxID=1597977 RepID=A0A286FXX3_9BACT|nr:hypothetical protein [Spirosoma fluviale]SOD88141.1 hypothetical protein SAMN06269250_2518 [Spirosoma fluviale]
MQRLVLNLYNTLKNKAWFLTLIFCLVCTAVIFFVKINLSKSYFPDISGSERSTTYGIQLIADGRHLYYNPEEIPFWVTQYAPIYYQLVGNMYRLTGWDPTDIHRVQLVSRIMSFALVLLAMVVVSITAYRFLRIRLTQTILFCCLVFGVLQHWHLTNSRADSLLFLCTTTYLYCMLRGVGQENLWNRYVLAAVLLSVTCFFIKQSGMIHIAILLAYLILFGHWRILIRTVGLMAVTFVGLTLLLDEGNYQVFFQNLFISLALPLSPVWFYDYTFRHLIPTASLLIAVSFLISFKWLLTGTDNPQRFLALATFMFFGFATATAFKHGAAVGYYHEFAYTGLLVIFWYFCNEKSIAQTSELGKYLFPAMICMTMLFFVSKQIERYQSINNGHYALMYRDELMVKKFVEPQLSEKDKIVVTFGDDFEGWMLHQMLFRHELAYSDDILRFLYNSKKYDFSRFDELVKQGGVKFIITPRKNSLYFTALNHTFDSRDYVLAKEMGVYQIYKHK